LPVELEAVFGTVTMGNMVVKKYRLFQNGILLYQVGQYLFVESLMIQYKAGQKGIGHQIMDLKKYISFMIHAKKTHVSCRFGLNTS
jgi:hypothetical protein